MCHQRFSQLFAVAACVAVLTCLSGQSHATYIELEPNNSNETVILADLLSTQVTGVVVGDKKFNEFFYTPTVDMPAAENVTVSGFQDLDGNYGLTFQGAFLDLPGNSEFSDAKLGFTVMVTDEAARQGYRISDAHLFLDGPGVGSESFFGVDESFAQSGVNDTLNTFRTTLNGSDESVLSDWVFFDELFTSLRVTKDILAIAAEDSNQPARGTVIRQSFSQVIIPEPATLTLLAMSALGIALGRRNS